jgi:hypothetical protein
LFGADLRDADTRDTDLSTTELFAAFYSKFTKFPEDFDPEREGIVLVK